MRRETIVLWILITGTSLHSTSIAAPSFCVLHQAPPGGAPFNTPYALSANGLVAAGSGEIGGANQAVVWTDPDGAFVIGPNLTRTARGVSADGSVVVGQTEVGEMAFRWTAATGAEGLNYLPGHTRSKAYAASSDGSVIVGECGPDSGGVEPFLWTETDGMVSLGFQGYAEGVSWDGCVIVGTANGTAFRWSQATGPVDLGTLQGGTSSYGKDVSGDGSVVVGYSTSETGTQAYRWTEPGGMVGLGYLSGGARSEAHAISADGSVIVGSAFSSDGEIAFIWNASDGMRPLIDVLAVDCGLGMTGWHLSRAYGVSVDGTVIAGSGTDPDDVTVAWMATIPEPAVLYLLALGGTAVFARGQPRPQIAITQGRAPTRFRM